MKKIAITGNIAAGKSEVEKFLAKHFPVYDTDLIAHKVLNDLNEFYNQDVFTNGKIDRKKLGDLIFSNPDFKLKLENLIHPKVKEEILEIFKKHSNDKYVFISVPLLFEVNWENMFDKIILVTADENIRLKRLIERNNFSKTEALSRIKAQIPQEEKIQKSDIIIENNSTKEDLNKKIIEALSNFL